ncbi:hypothetical protein AUP68_17426 [Ilyonectria robusta]
MAASRYREFRRASPEHSENLEGNQYGFFIIDEDGEMLYETEFCGLFLTMVRHDDVAMVKRYLTKYTGPIWPGDLGSHNPFWTAVHHGSNNVLRMLLEHEEIYPSQPPSYRAHSYTLLNEACRCAHMNTVLYLLENHPQIANIEERDGEHGMNALLSVACSMSDMGSMYNRYESRSDFIARREELMEFLLDKGACARDVVLRPQLGAQPEDTVLTMAISRASAKIVKRLLSEGADMHAKTMHDGFSSFGEDLITDCTALHFGSQYCNVDGIRTLIEHSDSASCMASCRDSFGRLPLHWAAASRCSSRFDCNVEEDEVLLYVKPTLDLLLDTEPTTINAQDEKGNTALHHAVKCHRACGGAHLNVILNTLCARGGDGGICNDKGETPLHLLSFRILNGDPIDASLVDLLLAHGCGLNAVDSDGNTPLHWAARNLGHIDAVRNLVTRGANVNAVNAKGNTPLFQAASAHLATCGGQGLTLDRYIVAQQEMIQFLQKAGGNIEMVNGAGKRLEDVIEGRRAEIKKKLTPREIGRGRGRGSGRID